jgi:MtN3 and saliva related transmembrane protein
VEGWLATAVGFVAGMCSASSFVPQVRKALREPDTEAISRGMYAVTVTAFSLWIVYGIMIGSTPIVLFNIVSLGLSGTILAVKIRNLRRGRDHAAAGPPARGGAAEGD